MVVSGISSPPSAAVDDSMRALEDDMKVAMRAAGAAAGEEGGEQEGGGITGSNGTGGVMGGEDALGDSSMSRTTSAASLRQSQSSEKIASGLMDRRSSAGGRPYMALPISPAQRDLAAEAAASAAARQPSQNQRQLQGPLPPLHNSRRR